MLTCRYSAHQNHLDQFEACTVNPIHRSHHKELGRCVSAIQAFYGYYEILKAISFQGYLEKLIRIGTIT